MQKAEIVVIGAGAAGLMAAITAKRALLEQLGDASRVVALDGAAKLGAKILIAGGGRCNVTHEKVDEHDFNGSTPAAIRRVLRTFDVDATIAFFAAEGVALKREHTGKLFPVSDRARDVLQALVNGATRAGVEIHTSAKVTSVSGPGRLSRRAATTAGSAMPQASAVPGRSALRADQLPRFLIETSTDTWTAPLVILATGGRSVPQTGSDGSGYGFARDLGLPLTPRVFPALVPLLLPDGHPLRALSGLATDVTLTVVSSTGRHIRSVTGSLLCTHLGVSGPAVLDVSRHWQAALDEDAGAGLRVNWLPSMTPETLDTLLRQPGARTVRRLLSPTLPERLLDALCEAARVDPAGSTSTLPRDDRRRLVAACTAYVLPVTGTRGFAVAEVTAGGVPLSALTATLEARACPGLFLCGEICDVDGRIGGFNFQWAWASGTLAGRGAAARVVARSERV